MPMEYLDFFQHATVYRHCSQLSTHYTNCVNTMIVSCQMNTKEPCQRHQSVSTVSVAYRQH